MDADKLLAALDAAVRDFRLKGQSYRNPNGEAAGRMSKLVRRDLAASYENQALILEAHGRALAAQQKD